MTHEPNCSHICTACRTSCHLGSDYIKIDIALPLSCHTCDEFLLMCRGGPLHDHTDTRNNVGQIADMIAPLGATQEGVFVT